MMANASLEPCDITYILEAEIYRLEAEVTRLNAALKGKLPAASQSPPHTSGEKPSALDLARIYYGADNTWSEVAYSSGQGYSNIGRLRALYDAGCAAGKAEADRLKVPDGWRLVPAEPTERMWDAGNAEYEKAMLGRRDVNRAVLRKWTAMLAAAPRPSLPGGEVVSEPTTDDLVAMMRERFPGYAALKDAIANHIGALEAENARLNAALTWEQDRSERIGTHAPGCWSWGHRHYGCLERRAKALEAELSAAVGYMENARIDLQTGAPKKTALNTISGGIARARAALRGEP